MTEFLTNLSSGPPLLWAAFVLGVMAAAALSLSVFWGGVFRAVDLFRGARTRAGEEDVFP